MERKWATQTLFLRERLPRVRGWEADQLLTTPASRALAESVGNAGAKRQTLPIRPGHASGLPEV